MKNISLLGRLCPFVRCLEISRLHGTVHIARICGSPERNFTLHKLYHLLITSFRTLETLSGDEMSSVGLAQKRPHFTILGIIYIEQN